MISSNNQIILPCNCKKKGEGPLAGKSRANDLIYKCIASATGFSNKVYLGIAQGEFKKRFYNHNTTFKNDQKRNDTALAKHVWDLTQCDTYIEMAYFKICCTILKYYKEV